MHSFCFILALKYRQWYSGYVSYVCCLFSRREDNTTNDNTIIYNIKSITTAVFIDLWMLSVI